MKILACQPGPAFSVFDCHRGWVRALRDLGCEVADFNLSDRLDVYANVKVKKKGRYVNAFSQDDAVRVAVKGIEAACYEFWPDVVFITSCFYVPPYMLELMRMRGHRIVILHTESPYEDDRQMERAVYADLNLVNDPTNIERFRSLAPTEYQHHCYDPDLHHPRPAKDELESDFCFVGTGYPSRVEFFEKVDWEGIDVALGGHWTSLPDDSPLRPFVVHPIENCLDNDDTVSLYTSTKLSANLYRTEAQRPELETGWSMGPRELELAACGVPFLRQSRGEGDELFPFLPRFETPQEFEDQLRYHLARPELRDELGRKAREAVSERTFKNSARRLLARLS